MTWALFGVTNTKFYRTKLSPHGIHTTRATLDNGFSQMHLRLQVRCETRCVRFTFVNNFTSCRLLRWVHQTHVVKPHATLCRYVVYRCVMLVFCDVAFRCVVLMRWGHKQRATSVLPCVVLRSVVSCFKATNMEKAIVLFTHKIA